LIIEWLKIYGQYRNIKLKTNSILHRLKIGFLKQILIIFSVLSSLFLNAQEYTISGTLVNGKNEPIAYANVLLYEKTNDGYSVAKGISSLKDGTFLFENLSAQAYKITASFLGYQEETKTITLSKDTVLNFVLNEESESLDEVVITAKKPTLKKEVDRLIFNVENTSLIEGTILEALRSTPGVLILDGRVSVKNTTPTVFINEVLVKLK